jgi:hypothetical protein
MAKRSGYSTTYFAARRAARRAGIPYSTNLGTEPNPPPKTRASRAGVPLGRRAAPNMVSVDGIGVKVPSNMRKSTLDRIRALPDGEQAAAVQRALDSQARAAAHHAKNAPNAGSGPSGDTGGGTPAAPPQQPGPQAPPAAPPDSRPQPQAQEPGIKSTVDPNSLTDQQRSEVENIASAYGDMYGALIPNAGDLARNYATMAVTSFFDSGNAYEVTGRAMDQFHVDAALKDYVDNLLGDKFSDGEKQAAINSTKRELQDYAMFGGMNKDMLDTNIRLAATAKKSRVAKGILLTDFGNLRSNLTEETLKEPSSESLQALLNGGFFNENEAGQIRTELTRRANLVGGLAAALSQTSHDRIGPAASDYMLNNRLKYNAGHLNGNDLDGFTRAHKFMDALDSSSDPNLYHVDIQFRQIDRSDDPDLQFAPGEDKFMKSIWRDQNFTNPMELVDDNSFNDLAKSGKFHVIYRGANGTNDDTGYPDTGIAVGYQQLMQSGDYYAGYGVYGQGTYFSPNIDIARGYANLYGDDSQGGAVIKVLLPKNARTTTTSALDDEMVKYRESVLNPAYAKLTQIEDSGTPPQIRAAQLNYEKTERLVTQLTQDMGHFASARGYDAYQVDNDGDVDHWVVLNRSNTISSKKILTRWDEE